MLKVCPVHYYEFFPSVFHKTELGCVIYLDKVYSDERGAFLQSFQIKNFSEEYRRFYSDTNLKIFTQDNVSWSKKNVVRGMHYQKSRPQGKLVRILNGKVIDVVIDIRPESKTYGKCEWFLLNDPSRSLYVPEGMAHGFWALEDSIFSYKCTDDYVKNDEYGINPLDPSFDWPWLKHMDDLIISPKDRALPFFS